nr:bromodomain-containing protein DDB_G0280777-like isoform X4 [Camelus dromedarius]
MALASVRVPAKTDNQILCWQQTGTQQLDWEQQGLQQLDWQQTGTQQLDWEQPQEPQPPLPQLEQEPQPPLPQLEQEQVGTQQHTGTQQLEPQPPLPQLEQKQAGTQRHTGTQQLEPQPSEQPQQLMVQVGGEWRRSEEQVEREGRCSGVAPPGPGAFIPLPGSGEMLGAGSLPCDC